jgi:hypothetical protein
MKLHLHITSTYKLFVLPEELIVDPRFSPCKVQSQCTSVVVIIELAIVS